MIHRFILFFLCLGITIILLSPTINASSTREICLNKSLKVATTFNTEESSIDLQIMDIVTGVNITKVYGIDGLEVHSYEVEEIEKNKVYKLNLVYDKIEGQSFILVNIEFNSSAFPHVNIKREVVSIPVGKLSDKQIYERRKQIKTYQVGGNEISGNGKIRSRNLKVHELPLLEKSNKK